MRILLFLCLLYLCTTLLPAHAQLACEDPDYHVTECITPQFEACTSANSLPEFRKCVTDLISAWPNSLGLRVLRAHERYCQSLIAAVGRFDIDGRTTCAEYQLQFLAHHCDDRGMSRSTPATVCLAELERDLAMWLGDVRPSRRIASAMPQQPTPRALSAGASPPQAAPRPPSTVGMPRPSEPALPPPSPSAQAPPERVAGSGTGFVVRSDGMLLTNRHVVEGCRRVGLPTGETLVLVASDDRRDLALLRAPISFGATMKFRRDQTIDLGEPVLLAGYPLYMQISTSINLTNGMVTSQVGVRDDPMRFQINAAMQPGNSGGPVMDASGLVIGVGVSRLNDRRMMNETGLTAQGMNYAIRGQAAETFLLENRVLVEKSPATDARPTAQIAQGLDRVVLPIICFR